MPARAEKWVELAQKLNIRLSGGFWTFPRKMFPVYALYLLFYLAAGGLLLAVVYGVARVPDPGTGGVIITAFSLSWILGFLTPGSPAGLGVREAALVAVLSHFIGEANSLFAALIFRAITSGGDLFLFLISFLLGGSLRPAEKSSVSE